MEELRPLKIRSKTMLATHHSWSVTMRSLISQFIKLGHEPHLISTNGSSLIPTEWQEYFSDHPDPDIDLCYTLPIHFGKRFQKNSKLKMAIYNYESSITPPEWKRELKHVDYVLPSSNFSRDIFVSNGWPKNKCVVVPHGINLDDFNDKRTVILKNDRKFQFLNVSIPHFRKNIDLVVDAYYKAFSQQDDVCLVLKTSLNPPKNKFECDVIEQIKQVRASYKDRKDLPMIEVVPDRFDTMIPLYNTCQVLVSASSSEGFGLPLLEALAANLIVIAPRCTGQLDFLNDGNSLLTDVEEVVAGPKYQYWRSNSKATTYKPIVNQLSQQMRKSFDGRDKILESFQGERLKIIEKFTWENAAKQIIGLK